MNRSQVAEHTPVKFAIVSILLGALGLFASFELLTEHIKTLENPDYIPNCAISVLVSCGPNMASWQGALLGFSNTIIGVAAFVAPIAVGIALLAGARLAPWFWWVYQGGLLLGYIFISWLAYQSVFILGTLCPWCMVVWAVMIPLFWITLIRASAEGDTGLSPRARSVFQSLRSWLWVIIAMNYVLIAAVAQFQLNWFAEFSRV